jgi:ABC-type uncharacterized transport system substrate-binding protein
MRIDSDRRRLTATKYAHCVQVPPLIDERNVLLDSSPAIPTEVSIGYLVLAPLSETPSPERTAFLAGLRALGWIEGKTIAVEYRSAKLNVELLDYLAEELVRTKVDIIVAAGPDPLIKAAKQATSTIPIVMTGGSDPVAERFVASLARPGGNVTGVSLMTPELGSKRLELLKEVVPRLTRLAVLWSPATQRELEVTRAAADKLGLALKLIAVRNADDVARAFAVLEKERPDALTMLFDGLTSGYRELVGDFAKKHKLPTVFGAREFAEAGGLMSYAPDIAGGFHRAATYVDISKHVGRVNSEPIVVDEIVA